MERAFCLLAGYFCGCFLTAELVARKETGKRAQDVGSGNPGMANITEHLGLRCGVAVLAGDVGKTAFACLLCRALLCRELGQLGVFWAGLGAVLGHNFPFYLNFKGGKGVAASVGLVIAFDWRIFAICAIVFFGLFFLTHYVSLCSVSAYLAAFISMIIFGQRGSYHMDSYHMIELYIVMGLLTVLAFYRHKKNIKRLLDGTESKIYLSKKNK